MKNVSVIGSTSPLGIDLVDLLADQGYGVHASYRTAERIPPNWLGDPKVHPAKLDLNDLDDLGELAQPTVIWLAHLDQGRTNENEVSQNTLAFGQFLGLAAASGVEKVVFVSSGGSVYGEPQHLPIGESHPRKPLSSYGRAKAAMEDMLEEFGRTTAKTTVVLRPGNIYGFSDPNSDHKGIVAAFLNAIRTQAEFGLIDEGRTIRDFIHVDDVTRAISLAAASDKEQIVWNVATGVGTQTGEVVRKIVGATGLAMPEMRQLGHFSSDVSSNILSIERITAESDWRPLVGLDDGIAALVGKRDLLT